MSDKSVDENVTIDPNAYVVDKVNTFNLFHWLIFGILFYFLYKYFR